MSFAVTKRVVVVRRTSVNRTVRECANVIASRFSAAIAASVHSRE
jgi:hypothetical protein